MESRLSRITIGAVAMILCAGAAILLPPLWRGMSGRDFRPQATAMAILIFGFAIAARRGLRWSAVDFIGSVLPIEFLTLVIVGSFSGFSGSAILDRFNLEQLAFLNLFVALPWFAGLGVGSVWLRVALTA